MNLVLSTVLIFIIILPGLSSRLSYFTYPFSNGARYSDFTKEIFNSIPIGIIIHFIYILIVELTTKFIIDFNDISFLIIGKEDNNRLSLISNNIHDNIFNIIIYLICLIIFSSFLGWILKKIVIICKLDKCQYFRFNNKWYYILTGRIIDVEGLTGESNKIELIGVDILCKVGNANVIYIGLLANNYLNNSGDLDAITLLYPSRRNFEDDNKKEYYDIPSDILYIPSKDIININVRYFNFKDEDSEKQKSDGLTGK
jgi:hypothetical protein